MTAVPRVLTIQDMSSIGRCALTVMIPIISAMRCQAVPLATAVLSNHLEYPHYEFVDLSAHMRDFMDCWDKNEIDFHAIVSGFLASPEQIHLVEEAIDRFGNMDKWSSSIQLWRTMVASTQSTRLIWWSLCANLFPRLIL